MITIDHALQDHKLLGASLGEPGTWATWLVTLKAAFGITLTDDERTIFASVAGSREPPANRLNELWGRRALAHAEQGFRNAIRTISDRAGVTVSSNGLAA